MKQYTGWQWLLIDAASHYGHDKWTFDDRLQWAQDHLDTLEALADSGAAKTRPLYRKAVMAIRDAQAGRPIHHLVGVDACCSGIQIMSALTGCQAGANATGLIDPDKRADAYSQLTDTMNQLLSGSGAVSRDDAKQALMTAFYGSKKTPKDLFGADTPELQAFYQAAQTIAPGAWELLQDLLASWNPYALSHSWKLPDGYDAYVKVMQPKSVRIEVDELDHATFTYDYMENKGSKKGLSNAANLVHSVDAYVMRTMHRRCNYRFDQVQRAANLIEIELLERTFQGDPDPRDAVLTDKELYYLAQYTRSQVVDITILPYLMPQGLKGFGTPYLRKLAQILSDMLAHPPFDLVTVHDEFKAHPNHINQVRFHYKEILADLADSPVLDDLLGQLYGRPGHFHKLGSIGTHIRNSNYALA